MGSDLAPFSTNLFLFYGKQKIDQEGEKDDIIQKRRFEIVFRFINDLNSLSNDGIVEWTLKEIYLPEFVLFKR